MDESRVVVITGAGSGIGRATAQAFFADGYRTVLVGRRTEKLQETAQQLTASGTLDTDTVGRILVASADVTKPEAVAGVFESVMQRWQRVDVLFNNAGINIPAATVDEIDFEDWSQVVAVNLNGMFLCTKYAVQCMKRQTPSGGRIINNGSISAHTPRPGSAAYTATKHAVTGLTKATNLDCRECDIACGQVDIGNAETQMVSKLKDLEVTIDVAHVAESILNIANLPLNTNVPFMTIMANRMPYMGRG
ncbi:MAG: SDR family oxidoreductase [Pirellulaceae bacterium]